MLVFVYFAALFTWSNQNEQKTETKSAMARWRGNYNGQQTPHLCHLVSFGYMYVRGWAGCV